MGANLSRFERKRGTDRDADDHREKAFFDSFKSRKIAVKIKKAAEDFGKFAGTDSEKQSGGRNRKNVVIVRPIVSRRLGELLPYFFDSARRFAFRNRRR